MNYRGAPNPAMTHFGILATVMCSGHSRSTAAQLRRAWDRDDRKLIAASGREQAGASFFATSARRGASPAAGYTSKSLPTRHLNRKRFASASRSSHRLHRRSAKSQFI